MVTVRFDTPAQVKRAARILELLRGGLSISEAAGIVDSVVRVHGSGWEGRKGSYCGRRRYRGRD